MIPIDEATLRRIICEEIAAHAARPTLHELSANPTPRAFVRLARDAGFPDDPILAMLTGRYNYGTEAAARLISQN